MSRAIARRAWAAKALTGTLVGLGLLAGLAFYTLHFGGFHFVHSMFLQAFFPVDVDGRVARGFPSWAVYAEVFRQYWMFVPVAFLAEREAFRVRAAEPADTSVTPEAIARRKRHRVRGDLSAPYRNVIRMHLLIFFFAGAHFLRLENFLVYAVVYAAYFFPWRMLRRGAGPAA